MEQTSIQPEDDRDYAYREPTTRQCFQHAHSSVSPTAHILKTATMLSPLIISEFVKDPARQWRYARIAILGATLIDQTIWAVKVQNERRQRGQRER